MVIWDLLVNSFSVWRESTHEYFTIPSGRMRGYRHQFFSRRIVMCFRYIALNLLSNLVWISSLLFVFRFFMDFFQKKNSLLCIRTFSELTISHLMRNGSIVMSLNTFILHQRDRLLRSFLHHFRHDEEYFPARSLNILAPRSLDSIIWMKIKNGFPFFVITRPWSNASI